MAAVSTTQNQFPLPAYNFRVSVEGVDMSFSEVSGLVQEYELITYKHGLSFLEGEAKLQIQSDKSVPVTLKRGSVHSLEQLSAWMNERKSRQIQVSLCDVTGQPVVVWTVKSAFPVRLSAPTFDANSNDVAIETLEVMASGISVEHIKTSKG